MDEEIKHTATAVDDQGGVGPRDSEIVATAKRRFQSAVDYEKENREAGLDDLKFLVGKHWPEELKRKREAQKRPCLTVNMLPKFVHNVTADARQNKPSIEVHPVDSKGDILTAQILEGIIRNIEYVSNASAARDTALDQSVKAGFGVYRVNVQYTDDDNFEQEIRVQRIPNQFSFYDDPGCVEPDRSDRKWCFLTEEITREDFKRRWPEFEPSDFESSTGDSGSWVSQDTVRVAEYWLAEPQKKTICLYELLDAYGNGTGVTEVLEKVKGPTGEAPVGMRILKERAVEGHKVVQRIIDDSQVLEENAWAGKYIPFITCLGEETFIDGKLHLASVIRYSKDPNLIFDYSWTSAIEQVALQPKAPWVGTPEMFEGHPEWDNANQEVYSKLTFSRDPSSPGDRPSRVEPPILSPAYVNLMAGASQALKDTSGIYDASLGNRSNETSGVAIQARQREGDIATFLWVDNLTRAITYEGKILVDLIPKIYDTERIIRIRWPDGSSDFQTINTVKKGLDNQPIIDPETGAPIPLNDVTLGKYDVVVTVGASYQTQREKQADVMTKIVQAFPPIAPLVLPQVLKNLDIEGADEIAKKLEAPPQVPGAGPAGAPGAAVPVPVPPVVGPAPGEVPINTNMMG